MAIITTTLTAENRFSGTMQQLATEVAQFRRSIVDGNRQSARSFETFGKTLSTVAANTKKSWQEMAIGLNSVFVLADGAIQRFRDVYRQFIRFEDAATRLAPLVGGLDAAKTLCRDLRDEAANGSMSFEQLSTVAGRLSAVFTNTDDVKKWTSIFHNISAGTGLDINELIGNFTKLKAAGRITGEFPEMFAQKGVNIFGELEKQTGKSIVELRKMASAGTLSFSEIEKALEAVAAGTGQFAGQAAKMSNTFGGSVGTMMANWDILKAEFSAPIAENLTPAIQRIAQFFRKSADSAGTFGTAVLRIGKIAAPFVGVYAAFKSVMTVINATKSTFGGLFAFTKSGFAQMAADAGKAAAATASVGNAASVAGGKFMGLARAASGIGALVGIGSQLGTTLYLEHLDNQKTAAEKLISVHRRLEDSMKKMETAKTEEDFDRARKNAEAISDLLAANQARWKEEAGMAPGAWNAGVFSESVNALRERKTAEWEEAKAAEAAAKALSEKNEALRAAADEYAKLTREQQEAALKAEIENAGVEDLPGLLLRQNGFQSVEELARSAAFQKDGLDFALAWGEATAAQVEHYRKTVELLDRVNAAEQKRLELHTEQQTRLDAAQKNYERMKALLKAEIAGDAAAVVKIRRDERYDALLNQFSAAGMDGVSAARAALEISELEAKKAETEKKTAENGGGNSGGIGHGLVATEQASVGGGRAMLIGGNGLVDISRRQLDMLTRIEKNTVPQKPGNIVPVLG